MVLGGVHKSISRMLCCLCFRVHILSCNDDMYHSFFCFSRSFLYYRMYILYMVSWILTENCIVMLFFLLCSWRVEGKCYWSTWRMSNLNSWSALSSELQTRCRISSVVWPTRLILCKILSNMYEFTHAENASTNTQVHVWLVEKPHKKKYLVVRRCTLI